MYMIIGTFWKSKSPLNSLRLGYQLYISTVPVSAGKIPDYAGKIASRRRCCVHLKHFLNSNLKHLGFWASKSFMDSTHRTKPVMLCWEVSYCLYNPVISETYSRYQWVDRLLGISDDKLGWTQPSKVFSYTFSSECLENWLQNQQIEYNLKIRIIIN